VASRTDDADGGHRQNAHRSDGIAQPPQALFAADVILDVEDSLRRQGSILLDGG
jgi:hypothetical protein